MKTIVFIFEFLLFVFLYLVFFFAMSMSFIAICNVFNLSKILLTLFIYLSLILSFFIVLHVYKQREKRIEKQALGKVKINNNKESVTRIAKIVIPKKQNTNIDIEETKESPKIKRNNERNIDL